MDRLWLCALMQLWFSCMGVCTCKVYAHALRWLQHPGVVWCQDHGAESMHPQLYCCPTATSTQVLARGEDGCQLPSCSFVQPLRVGGRLLSNPREAARFVALLRQRDGDDAMAGAVATLGGPGASGGGAAGVAECWCTLHTILTARAASKEELATLLASLLLGFGLDAYVAVGRLKTGPGHMWVVTRGAFTVATHWEPATGGKKMDGMDAELHRKGCMTGSPSLMQLRGGLTLQGHTRPQPPLASPAGVRYTSFDGASCPYATVGSVFNHLVGPDAHLALAVHASSS